MNRRDFIKGIFATAAYVAVKPYIPAPAPIVATATFEQIVEATFKAYRKILADNLFKPSPVWTLLKSKGMVNETSTFDWPLPTLYERGLRTRKL